MLLHETDPGRGGAPIEQLTADCPDDWREKIFAPGRPVIPWLRIKDFKLVTLKMIVSSMLLHQSSQIKKEPKLQALDKDILPTDPAESDEARVSHTSKRGFASVLGRLRLTSAPRHSPSGSAAATSACEQSSSGASSSETNDRWIDGVFVPGCTTTDVPTDSTMSISSKSSRPSPSTPESSDEPSLLTLGANLYVSGEVTQQQLGFPTKTTLIVSGDNPGAQSIVQEKPDPSPMGSNPNPNPNSSPNPEPKPQP